MRERRTEIYREERKVKEEEKSKEEKKGNYRSEGTTEVRKTKVNYGSEGN